MRTGIVRIIGGATLSVLMASYMPLYAYADTYDISEGSITVSRDETAQTVTQAGNYAVQDKEDSDPVITSNNQEVSGVTLTIEASAGQEAEVTIQNLNINDSSNGDTPAILTTGEGNVKINLDGVNVVKSGNNCAGLQKENEGNLIITDNNATGSLEATGGRYGAGIGGGDMGSGTDITIEGGTVTATGGDGGAGIGGGVWGSGTDITIEGGTVTATSESRGAGIGGGECGSGTDITIEGGTVTAIGGDHGAGIGGGEWGSGTGITIKEGGTVTATGGFYGAGIGGGYKESGRDITIKEGGTVTATGGFYGAGIGGGYNGSGTDITIKEGGTVTATGGDRGAGIGGGGAESGRDITIEGGTVTATGGNRGAGIGGGNGGSGTGITVSNNAHVMVSGGIYDQYSGAAIGDGVQYDIDTSEVSSGEEVSPDVSLLSSDGYILYYPAGTTANQIKNGSVQPTKILKSIITSSEALIDEGNTPQDEYAASEVISITHSSSGGSYVDNSEVNSIPTSSEEFAAFLAATNNTLEVYIKKIEAMMAAGDTEGLNALVSKGITLETGNWVCFNKKTYALIEKISDLGAPVTISFAYKGRRYSTVIPGKADIRPLDLCNEEGYCGFLNLIKYYGGGEK